MKDPYSVLGVSPSASDDEVKSAYRALAKKYHPDNYINNPLADLAQEKMKEINEAYDAIEKMRKGNSKAYSGSYSQSSSTNAAYAQIRQAISAGNIMLAEQLLSSCSNHDAEWNFLMGSVMIRKGWFSEARRYIDTACSMDPSNSEYNYARAQLLNMQNSPRGQATAAGMSSYDCCTSLLCAELCCDSTPCFCDCNPCC